MLRKLGFSLCAVLILGLMLRVQAEDAAPPPPAPTPAPAKPDANGSGAAPAPSPAPVAPAADAPKKDGDGKAAATPDVPGTLDPTVVSGTPPTFPIKADSLANVEDKYTEQEDASNLEIDALEDLFRAVRASTQEYLTQHVNPAITYVTMMNKPETCRGEVVKVSGTLRYVVEIDRSGKPPLAGATKYWRGQISVGTNKINSFISMEPLPADAAIGRGVNVTGLFMKRWVYTNAAPGEKGTWTPLIICRRIERVTDYDNVATGAMNSPIGIGIFVFVGAGILIFLWTRSQSKARYGNKFTRLKNERSSSGGRNFPRPG